MQMGFSILFSLGALAALVIMVFCLLTLCSGGNALLPRPLLFEDILGNVDDARGYRAPDQKSEDTVPPTG